MSLCIDIYSSSPCCLFLNSNPILLLLLMYMTLFFSLLIAIGYIEWIFEYLSERRPKQSIYRWEWSICSTLPSILCRLIPMIQCLNLSVSEFDWFFLLLPHSPLLHVSFLKTQILRTDSLTSMFDTSFSSIVIFSVFQYKIEFNVNVLLCFFFFYIQKRKSFVNNRMQFIYMEMSFCFVFIHRMNWSFIYFHSYFVINFRISTFWIDLK